MGRMPWLWAGGVAGVLLVSGLVVWGALRLVGDVGAPPAGEQDTADRTTPGPGAGGVVAVDIDPYPADPPVLDDAAQRSIDHAQQVTPGNVVDTAELLASLSFEELEGFLAMNRSTGPLRFVSDAEREAFESSRGGTINRHFAAEGWAVWRVTPIRSRAWRSAPMVWFDDGSPGVLLSDTTWYATGMPGDGRSEGERCWLLIAPAGAKPAVAYSFDVEDGSTREHCAAVLRDIAGREFSVEQLRDCMSDGLGGAGGLIVGDARIGALLIQTALGRLLPLQVAVQDAGAAERRWLAKPVEASVASDPSDDWGLARSRAVRALAQSDHPAMPGMIGQFDAVGLPITALRGLADGAVRRWHAEDRAAMVGHLRRLAVADTRRNDGYPAIETPDDAVARELLLALHRVDPDRAGDLAVSLLGHPESRLGWAAVTALQEMLGGIVPYSDERTGQIVFRPGDQDDYALAQNGAGDADQPNSAAASEYLFLLLVWPAAPIAVNNPLNDKIVAALARVADPQMRCRQAYHLLLMTRPEVPLAMTLDFLESRAYKPFHFWLRFQHGEGPMLDAPSLVRHCVMTGDRAGLERLARAGYPSPLAGDGAVPAALLFAALHGGDRVLIDRALAGGAGETFDADPGLARRMGASVAATGAVAGATQMAERWGTPENLAAWYAAACQRGNANSARVLLDAMDDASIHRGTVQHAIRSGDAGLVRRVADRVGRGEPLSDEAKRVMMDMALASREPAIIGCVLGLGGRRDRVWGGLADQTEHMRYPEIDAVLAVLIEHGFDPSTPSEGRDYTPLYTAIQNNDLRYARCLLDAGADPNQPFEVYYEQQTLLSYLDSDRARNQNAVTTHLYRRLLVEYGAR